MFQRRPLQTAHWIRDLAFLRTKMKTLVLVVFQQHFRAQLQSDFCPACAKISAANMPAGPNPTTIGLVSSFFVAGMVYSYGATYFILEFFVMFHKYRFMIECYIHCTYKMNVLFVFVHQWSV